MRKISVLIILSILCLGGCTNRGVKDDVLPTSSAANMTQDHSVIAIDDANIIKIDAPGCLPISTESIEDILLDTGRFTHNQVILSDSIDVYFKLDKPENEDSEGAARIGYSVSSENTTQIIFYNFSKSSVNGDRHDAIRWGLDLLLHIFGVELTDEAWGDIMEVASKSTDVGAMGTDYEGYADEKADIRLIYADLGDNVQIDIRPY